MKVFQSHKQVKAEPMMRFEAQRRNIVRDTKNVDEHGYYIEYADGYKSWSPKVEFEAGYSEVSSTKTLGNTCANGATKNVRDIVFWGDGDLFQLISKASSESEGWMKSTKAMDVNNGVVVQVTTQQRNPDGSYAIAEALTFVPGAQVYTKTNDIREIISRSIWSPN